jgi:hypothetical protein
MRYCESMNLNRWTYTEFDDPKQLALVPKKPKNNLYALGIGREEGHFLFQEAKGNPGMGAIVDFKTGEANPNAIQVATLDNFARERGWFESRPIIAILKGKGIARRTLAIAASKCSHSLPLHCSLSTQLMSKDSSLPSLKAPKSC